MAVAFRVISVPDTLSLWLSLLPSIRDPRRSDRQRIFFGKTGKIRDERTLLVLLFFFIFSSTDELRNSVLFQSIVLIILPVLCVPVGR
jgi:hypothetical protein